MSDADPARPEPPNVTALVQALEARARQAGTEAAMAVLRNELRTLTDLVKTIDERLGRLEDAFTQAVEESGSTQQIVDQIRDAVVASLPSLTPDAPAASPDRQDRQDHQDRTDEVVGALRSEAELLTQRVAALAVGVEATRALLEQHVTDAEASLGHKATELGRRVATELGWRGRRPSSPRRDRELGPGSR